MKPMTYTTDVQPTYSGTITFENVPESIYRAVTDLLGGRGILESREDPSRPETVRVLTLGQTIRKLRRRSNLTTRQVATWCGVTVTTVCRWESDSRKPTRASRERLCTLYGIPSIPLLFAEEEDEK